MNKLAIGSGVAVVLLGAVIFFKQSQNYTMQPATSSVIDGADETTGLSFNEHNHDEHTYRDHELEETAIHPLTHEHEGDEAGFDFTPYVSKEMADEIRPYTSRSHKGLEVKADQDGNEYVDLKKRWSHATISVVDENGVKHTGEWAPQ